MLEEITSKLQNKTIVSAVREFPLRPSKYVNANNAVVRVMPNIAIQFGESQRVFF